MTPLESWAFIALVFGVIAAFYFLLVTALDSWESEVTTDRDRAKRADKQWFLEQEQKRRLS